MAPSLEFAKCKIEKNPRAEIPAGPIESKECGVEEDLDFSEEDIPF